MATIALARGTVLARSNDDQLRELEKGAPVYVGDVIETANRSFAVVVFTDKSKVTLQPNSELDVEDFEAAVGEESIILELVKGGLRAITGQVGKRRPEKVSVRARTITVGIRGTTFAMRLCNLGEVNCEFRRGVTAQGTIAENDAEGGLVRVFVRDNNIDGPGRREISRQEYEAALGDTYAWLIEGKISVKTPLKTFELETARECLPGEKPTPQAPHTPELTPCVAPSGNLPQNLPKKQPVPPEKPVGKNPPKQPKPPQPPKR